MREHWSFSATKASAKGKEQSQSQLDSGRLSYSTSKYKRIKHLNS